MNQANSNEFRGVPKKGRWAFSLITCCLVMMAIATLYGKYIGIQEVVTTMVASSILLMLFFIVITTFRKFVSWVPKISMSNKEESEHSRGRSPSDFEVYAWSLTITSALVGILSMMMLPDGSPAETRIIWIIAILIVLSMSFLLAVLFVNLFTNSDEAF